MRVSLDWLQDYTEFDLTESELADRLTMTSLESEPILEHHPLFEQMMIGQIKSVELHPDADHLTVCKVDTASTSERQIICGAPNVATGQKVPVVPPGVTLPDGTEIKATEIRGVESHGIIPSERELGLSEAHAGIMVLRSDARSGDSFWEYLKQYWAGLNIEITPNRPDCMSHIGVAREVSAMLGSNLTIPETEIEESGTSVNDMAYVTIHEPEKCPRYAARVIRNISIGPSPMWLQQRLTSVGLRPINNIVDIANYVLMETGHPLHTFDYDTLAGPGIEVRSARSGEEFTTLDGQRRELDEEVLLICDADAPVAIAGVMGGENSEVTDSTTNLLIESAYFDPKTIRRSSKYLGISTEASKRFERGADPNGVLYALERITSLIQQFAGGEVASGVIDEYPVKSSPRSVSLRKSRTEQLLGVSLELEKITALLQSLDCEVEEQDKDTLQVTVPTFRPDITREVDLIEEILRLYGMEKVPSPGGFYFPVQEVTTDRTDTVDRITSLWKGFGFHQTYSNSLVKREYCYPETTGKTPVRVKNPLSEEMAYMRTTLLSLLLEAVLYNRNRKENNIRLIEFGRVFDAREDSPTGAEEFPHFGAICAGSRHPVFWDSEEKEIDFWDLKGYIQVTLEALGVEDFSFVATDFAFFEPGFEVMINGQKAGYGGRFQSGFLEGYDLAPQVFGIEINLQALEQGRRQAVGYEKPSDFPPVERDLSFVAPEELPEGQLSHLIKSTGGELLTAVELYDIYRGDPIPSGKKSLTYSLKFLSKERTLTEEEIDTVQSRIVETAEQELDVHLRRE